MFHRGKLKNVRYFLTTSVTISKKAQNLHVTIHFELGSSHYFKVQNGTFFLRVASLILNGNAL